MQYLQGYGANQKLAQKEMNLSRDQIEQLISQWIIGRNAERNRAIIRRRLLDGITYDCLAEEFDLSVRQVKNIVYKCEDRLYRHL